jgi:hypothetical protein
MTGKRKGAAGNGDPAQSWASRKRSSPRISESATSNFSLVIERAVTSNAPPFDQPWPATAWQLVREVPANKTLWRKIELADAMTAAVNNNGETTTNEHH